MFYGHGDDSYLFKTKIVADFSTNVWYGGEPEGLKDYIFQKWNTVNKYPEVLGESLTEKISAHHNLQPDNILISNGSIENIYLIAQAFRQKTTTIAIPSFAEYEDACIMYNHQIKYLDWRELEPTTRLNTDLFFLCNPNNPTGDVFFQIEELLNNNTETIFVIDEAFIEFTLSIQSAVPLINKYPNLIILRSLTKAYAIPGLRLGYMASCATLIRKIKSLKFPWSVNSLAIEAGNFIFNNYSSIQLPLNDLLTEKQEFISQLEEIDLKIHQSHTHFFLAETHRGTASELKQYFVDNFRILIRDAGNFRGLGEGYFRVATLSPHKNQLLLNALKEWKNRYS